MYNLLMYYMSSVLDVYLGHVHMFEYIKNNGVGRFNTILTDIYSMLRRGKRASIIRAVVTTSIR
jgi:hypothetical protein